MTFFYVTFCKIYFIAFYIFGSDLFQINFSTWYEVGVQDFSLTWIFN